MTKEIRIAALSDPDTKEVTLFVFGENWGPIVTGKNLEEAKTKMKEAMRVSMIYNSLTSNVEGKLRSSVSIPQKPADFDWKAWDSQIDGVFQ